jgi:hypothetical protein
MQRNISSTIGAGCRASARCLGNMAQEHVGIAQRNAKTASQNAKTVDQPSCARVSKPLCERAAVCHAGVLAVRLVLGMFDYVVALRWWP